MRIQIARSLFLSTINRAALRADSPARRRALTATTTRTIRRKEP
jgi:hypothetical protein